MFEGNRLEEGRCIRCGAKLIDLNSKWHMCTECIKQTQTDIRKMAAKKKVDKGSPRLKKVWIPMLGRKTGIKGPAKVIGL